jgi:hypothetical protein
MLVIIILIPTVIFFTKKYSIAHYDLNNDDKIGMSDITQLSIKIGQFCDSCPEDIDKDGFVDNTDLNILLKYYEQE